MITNSLKKNKINLSDYPYQKDIEFRLIMSEFTVFDVNLINEIVQGSLSITIPQLAESLEVNLSSLLDALEKLKKTKLFTNDGEKIFVDKEMRKYYEHQILKFDDDFRADMGYLRGLLNKVPLHILPVWYPLPRTSDDIFQSIIDKHLLTPKIYRRYLTDLTFDDPVLNNLVKDVYEAPDFKVQGKDLIEKYSLTREKFEEYILQLEFNLVCCLSYNQNQNKWEEVVTPFYEWRQFLRHQRDTFPKQIQDKTSIQRHHPNDFGFVQDMTKLLQKISEKPIALNEYQGGHTVSETASDLFVHLSEEKQIPDYASDVVTKMLNLQLAQKDGATLCLGKCSEKWLGKPIQEQAIAIYRSKTINGGYIDRDLREVERCLKHVSEIGWIYFDDFAEACIAPIGEHEPVMLKNKGRRWWYQIPKYSSQDKEILFNYIFDTLFQSGIVAIGSHEGKPCFTVTPFGRMTLD